MKERLEMVGGRFGVESAPGKGTSINAFVPGGKPAVHQKRTRRRKPVVRPRAGL